MDGISFLDTADWYKSHDGCFLVVTVSFVYISLDGAVFKPYRITESDRTFDTTPQFSPGWPNYTTFHLPDTTKTGLIVYVNEPVECVLVGGVCGWGKGVQGKQFMRCDPGTPKVVEALKPSRSPVALYSVPGSTQYLYVSCDTHKPDSPKGYQVFLGPLSHMRVLWCYQISLEVPALLWTSKGILVMSLSSDQSQQVSSFDGTAICPVSLGAVQSISEEDTTVARISFW